MSNPCILIVEDEASLASSLEQALRESGFSPIVAPTAAIGAEKWKDSSPELVLLDIMLPDSSGLDLLRQARSEGRNTPVIVISAKNALTDRVTGLDLGADDYLTKPFSLDELMARVRAHLRRQQDAQPSVVRCGELEIDLFARRATLKGRLLFFSATEFRLLELLALHLDQPVSKTQILEYVWDDPERDPNVVEVYVNYLRNKLERGGATRLIHTMRGQGYALREPKA